MSKNIQLLSATAAYKHTACFICVSPYHLPYEIKKKWQQVAHRSKYAKRKQEENNVYFNCKWFTSILTHCDIYLVRIGQCVLSIETVWHSWIGEILYRQEIIEDRKHQASHCYLHNRTLPECHWSARTWFVVWTKLPRPIKIHTYTHTHTPQKQNMNITLRHTKTHTSNKYIYIACIQCAQWVGVSAFLPPPVYHPPSNNFQVRNMHDVCVLCDVCYLVGIIYINVCDMWNVCGCWLWSPSSCAYGIL